MRNSQYSVRSKQRRQMCYQPLLIRKMRKGIIYNYCVKGASDICCLKISADKTYIVLTEFLLCDLYHLG